MFVGGYSYDLRVAWRRENTSQFIDGLDIGSSREIRPTRAGGDIKKSMI